MANNSSIASGYAEKRVQSYDFYPYPPSIYLVFLLVDSLSAFIIK
jgi:hypothetical protein